jgi:hypothetical protein
MDFSSTMDMRKVIYYWLLYSVNWYYSKLVTLRDSNIVNATFEDKVELVSRLVIKIIPSQYTKEPFYVLQKGRVLFTYNERCIICLAKRTSLNNYELI